MTRPPNHSGLADYARKRNFARTTEPAGGALKSAGSMFVVQKHAATRLHYDFRLEHDGVLLSWAVPQGPSLDPAVKRLAMRTENHPLEYGSFEGTIPKGEYGAGSVIIWDTGTAAWVKPPADTLPLGKLEFVLNGERLKGEFHLVKIKPREGERGEPWLLFKSRDAFADRGDVTARALTSVATGRTLEDIRDKGGRVWSKGGERSAAPKWDFVPPALCQPVELPPDGDRWLHEIKYDGYRLIAAASRDAVRLYTRTGLDWTAKFPRIAEALARLQLKDVLLDGEAAVADAQGRTDFGALQRCFESGGKGASYFVFDVIAAGADDLRKLPLIKRKARLAKLLEGAKAPIRLSPYVEGDGPSVFAAFRDKQLEGVVSKRADSAYRSGRSNIWLKAKCVNEREFVIVGYRPSARRAFSSLLLADHEGGELVYRGDVGTGFSEATLKSLAKQMAKLERKTPPLAMPRESARGATWLKPTLVAQVRYADLTSDGMVRHGVFLGLRGDKPAEEVAIESELPARKSKVRLTHPDRVLFPDAGVTKAEYAAYLEAVAARMGPHVFGRPISLVRAPDGAGGQTFFQKHAMTGAPPALETTPVRESDGSLARYLTAPNLDALAACAQMSALEIHIWGARNDDLEKPDRMVFDLDPDEGVSFERVKRAAFDIKALLDTADLPSFALLTGGKGVHIVLHLKRRHAWEDVKAFSGALAHKIAELDPQRFVATMTKAKRKGRIFIDYFRNHRGATAIAPYSARARGTAPIAAPVSWDELRGIASASAFKLRDMAARLREPDPWADYAKSAVTLTRTARAKLGL
ncbi:MAG: DNA ligase D [Hyphomonadaceae bacterium]|nr:DNA ligase D [Hyphomonadaceae bacterium]